ncbi:uncharacterized protein B0T15DRAFT_577730 [Chaetomium strumarium]|uniref:Uncharacterized protein n=1 Tax=Chaetomium strumarium TaxID=1170767 RepID=A0AAJ0LYR6_9PEZI|nr:hypothetical protein B0T15DRAFT_577730 [Chaetomium strumarium]
MSDTSSSGGYQSSDDYPESILDTLEASLTTNRGEESTEQSSLPFHAPRLNQPGAMQQLGHLHVRHVDNAVAGSANNNIQALAPAPIPDQLIDPILHEYQAIADKANAARPPSPWGGRMLASVEYEPRRARRAAYDAAQAELAHVQARPAAFLEAEARSQAAAATNTHSQPSPNQAQAASDNENNRRHEPAAPRGQGERAQRNATLHALGLCVHCRRPNVPGSKKKGCPECRAKRAKLTNAWRDKTSRGQGPGSGGPGSQGPPPPPRDGAVVKFA